MSTKCSHVYLHNQSAYTHVYKDLLEPEKIVIEKKLNQNVSIKLDLNEIGLLVKSFDLQELERQANLTDDDILKYVDNNFEKCKNNTWSRLWFKSICDIENPTDDELKLAHYKDLIKTRDKIKALRDQVNSEGRVVKHQFGLEEIK